MRHLRAILAGFGRAGSDQAFDGVRPDAGLLHPTVVLWSYSALAPHVVQFAQPQRARSSS